MFGAFDFVVVEMKFSYVFLVQDYMNCAKAYVKFNCQWLLDNCLEDMDFMADKFDKGCIDHLKLVTSTPFIRVTYTEAVEILEDIVKNGKKFENEQKWVIDLAFEHERYA